MSKAKVYVPHVPIKKTTGNTYAPVFDIKPAEHFGELVMLSETREGMSMFFTVPTVRQLKQKLRAFNEDDYVLAIGDPSLIATVAMIAGQRNHGRVKMLKWDRLQRCYLAVQIDTTGKPT